MSRGGGRSSSGVPTISATIFRNAFNNASGGCFGPGGAVRLADGTTCLIQDLRKGCRVLGADGGAHKVLCMVTYSGAKTLRLPAAWGSLSVTAWHPVRRTPAGAWRFPADVAAEEACEGSELPALCEQRQVYNVVLESGHVVLVDGVECVTLGHGFQVGTMMLGGGGPRVS